MGLLALIAVISAIAGNAASSELASRLEKIAPEVHSSLGKPTHKTLFWYGRLPHPANAALARFIWGRRFTSVDDRNVQIYGWVSLLSGPIVIICFLIMGWLEFQS